MSIWLLRRGEVVFQIELRVDSGLINICSPKLQVYRFMKISNYIGWWH